MVTGMWRYILKWYCIMKIIYQFLIKLEAYLYCLICTFYNHLRNASLTILKWFQLFKTITLPEIQIFDIKLIRN